MGNGILKEQRIDKPEGKILKDLAFFKSEKPEVVVKNIETGSFDFMVKNTVGVARPVTVKNETSVQDLKKQVHDIF